MKIQKMFMLDIELVMKLKDINASALVNSLLLEYFKSQEPKTLEDLQRRKQEIMAQIEYENKLEEIKQNVST